MATYTARHPVAAAQLIKHGATDTLHRVGSKGRALHSVITLNGVQQADSSGLQQIVELHAGGQPDLQAQRLVAH
ncbi:hypothetical protein D3C78_1121850 [compost metagenome]